MLGIAIRLAANAIGLVVIAAFSGGAIHLDNFGAALLAALVLGLVNAIIKPVLLFVAKSMTCALSCVTLGLWSLALTWIINALLFFIVGQNLQGFRVTTFSAAFWGALGLSIVNALAGALVRDKGEAAR